MQDTDGGQSITQKNQSQPKQRDIQQNTTTLKNQKLDLEDELTKQAGELAKCYREIKNQEEQLHTNVATLEQWRVKIGKQRKTIRELRLELQRFENRDLEQIEYLNKVKEKADEPTARRHSRKD